LYRPQIHENNGATKLMFPQEVRSRNFTYASAMTIDINIKFVVRNGKDLENIQTFYKTLPKIHIGKMPIMLKSNICVLTQYKHMENTIVERKCDKCEMCKTMDKYRKYTDRENHYSKTCKKCLNEMDKTRKKNQRQKKMETFMVKCEKCNGEKPLKDFAKLKKFYKKKICLSCYPRFLTEQKNEWCRNESKTNMNYRLKKSLAARLRNVLDKKDCTMNYIGCNIQYLREWFQYNFTSVMTWDNYGSYWSIDHIIPVCKFDLTIEGEKLKCWNWTNLMPVSVQFNSSKKEIDMNQVNNIIEKIEKFKEEGSTTKWFSREFMLNIELVNQKMNSL
jgi:hypothetical protein